MLPQSIPSLMPQERHILVAGDVFAPTATDSFASPDALSGALSLGAASIAVRLASRGFTVSLLGFVGDDALGSAVQQWVREAGVEVDLLAVSQWPTFYPELGFVEGQGATTAEGVPRRQHSEEQVLPLTGLSEYQAHFQNRCEKYMANASLLVVVDLAMGSVNESRALSFCGRTLGCRTMAILDSAAHPDDQAQSEQWDVLVAPDSDVLEQRLLTLAGEAQGGGHPSESGPGGP